MVRTHVILDGLQDPDLGRKLSAAWAKAGFVNVVDVTGQCAWLEPDAASGLSELNEAHVDGAAAIARGFGLELRDRVGSAFRADNDLAALHQRMAYEYKSRFATALVFGLPAIALHYAAPVLAGGGQDPRAMVYPWLFETILVGWACLAAGWPILWQGALSAIYLRTTADLLTTLIVLGAFIPSLLGLFSMGFRETPLVFHGRGPLYHAAMLTVVIAVLQRWLAHRAAARISGRVTLVPMKFDRAVGLWIAASVIVAYVLGWRWGIAVAMVFPPMVGLGAVNRWSPGWSLLLPVIGFAWLMLAGRRVLHLDIAPVSVEVSAGFGLLMSLVMAAGWRRRPLDKMDSDPNKGPRV
jgi:hypothetical protein